MLVHVFAAITECYNFVESSFSGLLYLVCDHYVESITMGYEFDSSVACSVISS